MGKIHRVSYGEDVKKTEPSNKQKALAFNIKALDLAPVDASNIEEIKERTRLYLDGCADADIKPGVQGLCLWLGVDRQTWYAWCHGTNRRDTHHDYCNRVMVLLAANWENNMQDNKTNAVSGIFLGKNDFGYKDKSEVVVEPKQSVTNDTTMNDVMALIEEPEEKPVYIEAQYTEIDDSEN